CDPQTGCGTEVKVNGSQCSDGNICTGPDRCTDGVCSGPAINCNDRNFCTTDRCDDALGCVNTPIDDCNNQQLGVFCTLTQQTYASPLGAANGPQGSVTNNPSILPASIGAPGTGRSVTIATQAGLTAFLETSGPANALCGNPMPVACPGDLTISGSGDVPDPSGSRSGGDGAGVLAGETLAATLSVALSNLGANPTGLGSSPLTASFCTCNVVGDRFGPFTISQCIRENATTVNNLISLANQALRGISLGPIDSCLSYGEIADALGTINRGFEQCRQVCSCAP